MKPLEGIRVLELASWILVPTAGAVLADWGAEVIKVEHPTLGDHLRGLVMSGPGGASSGSPFEQINRGKRSVGIDAATAEGRSLVHELAGRCDVFLTNFLPAVRARLGVGVNQLRAVNPDIIYAKGSGFGPHGPEHRRGGFDYATYWSRGGVSSTIRALNPSLEYPPRQLPALGDVPGGTMLAGGVAAALVRRALQGQPSIVDVSLLGLALWQLASDGLAALESKARSDGDESWCPRADTGAPLRSYYETKDGRFLLVYLVGPERLFADACQRIRRADLLEDIRFGSGEMRESHGAALRSELEATFASRTLTEWRQLIGDAPWVCEPVQTAAEVARDPQVAANDYLIEAQSPGREPVSMVASPVQFDERSAQVSRAPEHGADTDAVLEELGYDWPSVVRLKVSGAIL